MKLTFETADARDIDAIEALARAHIEQYEDMSAIDPDEVFAWVRRKLEKRIGEYLRIVCDGATAGYLRVVPPENDSVELDDLYLYPAYQGRGIGTAALRRCIEQTKLPLWFYVFRRNTRAIALYERLGFRIAEIVGPTRCIMRRERRPVTVCFVRHGETDQALRGSKIFRGYGANLLPLTEAGVRQIRETAKDARLQGAELILSSPYTRALQSAAILSKELGLEVAVEADLHEWVANKTYVYENEDAAGQACREFLANSGEYPADGERAWEDAAAIRRRVFGVLQKYGSYQRLIVVCHSMVMMAVTGQPRAKNGEIIEFRYE